MSQNIAVIGGSGAIAQAIIQRLLDQSSDSIIHAFSRTPDSLNHLQSTSTHRLLIYPIDYDDENSIQKSADMASKSSPLDLVFVATGILHEQSLTPEKSLSHLSSEKLMRLFQVNTIVPSLIAKHFVPKLHRQHRSVFAALSARIGSISDNRLGGWYSYRASKAALNMMIKTIAIESKRQNQQAIIVGLHPGTVDSPLSKPFQKSLPVGQLLHPLESAKHLIHTIDQLKLQDSGKIFAFDGKEIIP